MRRFLRNNGLSLAMFGLFVGALVPMSVVGHHAYNSQLADHGRQPIRYATYLTSGDFIEGVFENWESEFLQMGVYVLLTAYLFQKGSPESKPLDEQIPQDVDPQRQRYEHRPWPVRKGGVWLKLYMRSLAVALFSLFVLSFALHAFGGATAYNQEAREHQSQTVSVFRFMTTSEFWYQSFQNWQSEFLAMGSLVVLAIFLRQQGSPESKPVGAPHSETGA
jgi:hypothetical protein